MKTISVRNVPEEVYARLDELAKRSGMSMNAVVLHELTNSSRRAMNGALLDGHPICNSRRSRFLMPSPKGGLSGRRDGCLGRRGRITRAWPCPRGASR